MKKYCQLLTCSVDMRSSHANVQLLIYHSNINPFVLFFQLDNLESILGGLRNSGSGMFADSGTGGTEGGNKQGNGPNSTAHGE